MGKREMTEEDKIQAKVDERLGTAVYKWMKIAQAIILAALGIIFIVAGVQSKEGLEFGQGFWIAIGVVVVIYGLFDILAGYLLNRNLLSTDVLIGSVALSFSMVIFLEAQKESEFVISCLNIFLLSLIFVYAILLIVFGVDRVVGKNGAAKNVTKGVFAFIGAAVLIVLGILYIIFGIDPGNQHTDVKKQIGRYLVIGVGAVLIILAIAGFVTLMIKLHNTKEMANDKKRMEDLKKSQQENTGDSVDTPNVVDYDSVKKEREKESRKIRKERKEAENEKPEVIDVSNQNTETDSGKQIEDTKPAAIENKDPEGSEGPKDDKKE